MCGKQDKCAECRTLLRIVASLSPGHRGGSLGAAYTAFTPTDLFKPIWEHDAGTLWRDLSAHLVYDTVTALTFRVLTRSRTTRS